MTETITFDIPGYSTPITGLIQETQPMKVISSRSPFIKIISGLEWIYVWGAISYAANQVIRNITYRNKLHKKLNKGKPVPMGGLLDNGWLGIIPKAILWPLFVPTNWLMYYGTENVLKKNSGKMPCCGRVERLMFSTMCDGFKVINQSLGQIKSGTSEECNKYMGVDCEKINSGFTLMGGAKNAEYKACKACQNGTYNKGSC